MGIVQAVKNSKKLLTVRGKTDSFCCNYFRLFPQGHSTRNSETSLVCVVMSCCILRCPGDYGIHVKYNDEHVPNSPAFVHIAPESKDAALVTVHGLKDRGLDVRVKSPLSLCKPFRLRCAVVKADLLCFLKN